MTAVCRLTSATSAGDSEYGGKEHARLLDMLHDATDEHLGTV
jgi:hypothetical protein